MPGQPPKGKEPSSLPEEDDSTLRWRGAEEAERTGERATPPKGLKVGALGVAEHYGTYGRGRYAGATGEGERVGVKGVSVEFEQPGARAAKGDALVGERPGTGIGVHGVSGAGTGVRGESRTGVGVAGKSRSVAGIEGQSEHDVGGVFVSATQAQLRLYPTMRELPDTARAGDLLAVLGDDATLDVPTAELWFCVRASHEHHKAVWKRVCFDASWPEQSADE